MILESIPQKVVFIGISPSAKGGIAAVEREHKNMFRVFRHITTSRDNCAQSTKMLLFAIALVKLLYYRLRGCTVAHFHGAAWNSFKRKALLNRFAKLLHFKTIYHHHGGDFKNFVNYVGEKYIIHEFERYDILIVLSVKWKDYFKKIRVNIPISIIPNPAPKAQDVQLVSHKTLHLLYMGFLYREKGIYDLLDVVTEHVSEWQGKIRLKIAGNARTKQEDDYFKKAIQNPSLKGIVEYIGYVQDQEKVHALAWCDALILPSHYEGLPMCILEAMSYGKAILATRVGAIPEIIIDQVNGYLFPPKSHKHIFQSISKLLLNKENVISMGIESLNLVKNYTPENHYKRLIKTYLSL